MWTTPQVTEIDLSGLTASARWRLRNPEKYKAGYTRRNTRYYTGNTEKILAQKHRPEVRARNSARRAERRQNELGLRERDREAQRRYNAAHPQEHLERTRTWRRANPVGKLLQNAAERARKLGLEFSITAADLEPLPTHCPILGIKLIYSAAGGGRVRHGDVRFNAMASLDRKDNTKGYVKENIAVISWRANRIKNDGTAVEHLAVAKWMGGNLGDR